ncbi:MAG: hypothetical protein RBR67_07105 [Desulfobacterium sp.]|jgi:phosphotransferase system  glucose/maltose/N-acetylglucosamine-specific IIC component|nr:hypothetical protein [Desulfobacterium sp.]
MNGKPSGGGQTLSQKSLSDFQKILEDRYSFHKEKAERHVKTFKLMGFVFGLAIPIFAALVTFSMSTEFGTSQSVSAVMGLALTLLTIVNSVIKPDERFAKGSQTCIALNQWKLEFDIHAAEADTADEAAFHVVIKDMDKKLSEIGKTMAEGWIPKLTA